MSSLLSRRCVVGTICWATLMTCGVITESGLARAQDTQTLATVNAQKITQRELDFQYAVRRLPQEQRESAKERIVDDLINNALLKQFLAKQKVEASKALVDQRLTSLEILLTSDGKKLDQVLQSHGMTRTTFRELVALPLRWRTYAGQVVNDNAIREYWDKHRSELDGTEVRAAHIVKKIPAMSSAENVSAMKADFIKLRDRLLKKELTFAEAAKQSSESPSAADGGDLGRFPFRGKMPLEITQVAFKLKPGDISEPFQSQFGLHLLTVTEIVAGDLSLEDARAEIFELLSSELQKRLIKQLRDEAKIERPRK